MRQPFHCVAYQEACAFSWLEDQEPDIVDAEADFVTPPARLSKYLIANSCREHTLQREGLAGSADGARLRFCSEDSSENPYFDDKASDDDITSDIIVVNYLLVLKIPNSPPGEIRPPLLGRNRPYRGSISVVTIVTTAVQIKVSLTPFLCQY